MSTVRFRSTRLNTLLASPDGGPPIVVSTGPMAVVGAASSQGRCLLLVKSVGRTSPTYVHNKYIVVRYSDTHKNDIYKK